MYWRLFFPYVYWSLIVSVLPVVMTNQNPIKIISNDSDNVTMIIMQCNAPIPY